MRIIKFLKKYFEKKYFGTYKHARKLFVFDIILLILAIFLVGFNIFWFFWQPSISNQVEINFAYSSQKIVSGEDLEIFITYKNNSKFNLQETVLSLHLPAGFALNKAKNEQISDYSSINLGQIKPGGNGKITISGQLVGDVTKTDKILATLTYKIGKTGKTDQKNSIGYINYSGSKITGILKIEETAFPDKEIPFIIKLANLSQNCINNLSLELPNYAKISQNNDKIDNFDSFSLEANQELTLGGIAKIPKTIGDLPFTYTIKRKFNQQAFIQNEENKLLKILNPNISLKLNPQIIKNYLDSGETLNLDIYFENLSGNILQNQILILEDKNNILDLPACAQMNNIKISDNKLIIDSSFTKAFVSGTNLKSDRFTLKLKLKDDAGAIAPTLDITPIFSAELFNSNVNFSVNSYSLQVPIASLFGINSQVRYYTINGDQIGRGPLPPQVGMTTKYWLYIDAKNGVNPLNDVSFSIQTAENTIFTSKQSVSLGKEIDIQNNKASWNIETIPALTNFGLYLEIETTPTAKDIGKNIELIKEIKIKAIDAKTGKNYEINLGPIVNILEENDIGGKFGSEVVK